MKQTTTSGIHCPASTWRLTDDFLVEERGDGTRLWGRWDRTFGCWDRGGNPVVPADPMLGRLGVWLEPPGIRDDDWYFSRAAVAAYWSLVPTAIRLVAAKAGAGQWETLLARAGIQRLDR